MSGEGNTLGTMFENQCSGIEKEHVCAAVMILKSKTNPGNYEDLPTRTPTANPWPLIDSRPGVYNADLFLACKFSWVCH